MPVSIDGTDITGATIDGQDVQEITVDGDTVFTAATFVDNFESGNLNKWNDNGVAGDLSAFTVVSSPVHAGSFALEATHTGNNRKNIYLDQSASQPTPALGDSQEFYLNTQGNNDTVIFWLSDKTTNVSGFPAGHAIRFDTAQRFQVGKITSSNIDVASQNVSYASGYMKVEVEYLNNNNDLKGTLIDVSNGNVIASLTKTGVGSGFGTSCGIMNRYAVTNVDEWSIV